VHVAQLCIHDRAEHAAATVRRVHADDGDPRARQRSAGHREVERECATASDDLAVLERSVHAFEVEHLREPLEALLVRRRTEVLPDPEDRVAVLLQVLAGAHLEHAARLPQRDYPIFSSGA
jgi:hypothetical protein